MTDTLILISVGILAITTLILGILVVVKKRRQKGEVGEPNYRAFFIMGITFFSSGLVFMIIYLASDIPFVIGMPLFALGLIYLIIGLANRDKWQKK